MLQPSDFPLQIIVQRKHGIQWGTQWARNGESFVGGVEAFPPQYRMRVAFHVQSSPPTAVRMYIQLHTADTQLIPL